MVRDVVRDIGSRLRSETTILDHEVPCIGKHGHGGGKTDRRWEQKAVKFMSTCEHKSQTILPRRILPMFDLSPPDDSPTQFCAMTDPLSQK